LATAFNLSLEKHPETLERMMSLSTPERREELANAPADQKQARERMALFPVGKGGHGSDGHGGAKSEVIFVEGEKWVPVVRLGGKVGSKMRSLISALRFPGYPQVIPVAGTQFDAVPPASSGIFEAF
jgi:hypothetical protein